MRTTPTRRELLKGSACGFGSLAFSAMAADGITVPRQMFQPKAKRVIFIYLQGGPSQVDTYDYKPELFRAHEKETETYVPRTRVVEKRKMMQPFWDFEQHGQSGRWGSTLFPEINKHVDELCFIHSMHTEGVAHGPATLFLHTGATNLIRPSMGAWISYGLGSENENLPAFVTINPPANKGGPRNYGTAFLPPNHQGTVIGSPGNRNAVPTIRNLESPLPVEDRTQQHEFLSRLNRIQQGASHSPEIEGAIKSFEMAWRMQNKAADVVDLDREPTSIRALYGVDEKPTDGFARQCLAARQLAEAGVRFIQISHCDNGSNPVWDQHSNMPKHETLAKEVDRPIAGLLSDLKQRGLLEDTLVWWGSEFGRTPFSQNNNGRDHNPSGFTTWLAGGGVKKGFSYGSTDELGFQAIENKVHMHDLHATILHALGVDHEALTYRSAGRDFRLTDVFGHVVHDIFA